MSAEENLDLSALGSAIKAARKQQGLMQPQLAGLLGFPQSAISFAEKGQVGRVSLERIKQIAEKVGVNWKQYAIHAAPKRVAKWYCREPGCPAAHPIALDRPSGWAVKMKPFLFSSLTEECIYCGEAATSESETESLNFIDDVPKGYLQFVASFNGNLDQLIAGLNERRRKLMEQAMPG